MAIMRSLVDYKKKKKKKKSIFISLPFSTTEVLLDLQALQAPPKGLTKPYCPPGQINPVANPTAKGGKPGSSNRTTLGNRDLAVWMKFVSMSQPWIIQAQSTQRHHSPPALQGHMHHRQEYCRNSNT